MKAQQQFDLMDGQPIGDGTWTIHLERALWRTHGVPAGESGDGEPLVEADCSLYLEVREGRLRADFLAYAFSYRSDPATRRMDQSGTYNKSDHEGRITAFMQDGGVWRFEIELTVDPDVYMLPGGEGRFAVELKRAGDGSNGDRSEGTFQGVFEGRSRSGQARGAWEPAAPCMSDWKPLEPGEHPRLALRAHELPFLRERAARPEGQVILARLREQLSGPFTLWHAAGHGLLALLASDPAEARAQAERARVFAERVMGGEKDSLDPRYTLMDGKVIRRGPSAAALAMAYDLNYHYWDDAFRRCVAGELARQVLFLARGGGFGFDNNPWRNWYGASNGSGGVCALAILGDARDAVKPPAWPETHPLSPSPEWTASIEAWQARTDAYLDPRGPVDLAQWALGLFERRIRRLFSENGGFGEKGYFWEGHHYSNLPGNMGVIPFLIAMRNARGEDLSGAIGGHWLMLRWLMDVVAVGQSEARYLRRSRAGGGDDLFVATGISMAGTTFAHGFALCPEELKPAALWFHDVYLAGRGTTPFCLGVYPHRALYALRWWPMDTQPRKPAELLPRAFQDARKGYFIFRDGWEGPKDIVASLLTNREGGEVGPSVVLVRGLGLRLDGAPGNPFADIHLYGAQTVDFQDLGGGSGSVSLRRVDGRRVAFLADYSGRSGCAALFLLAEQDAEADATATPVGNGSSPMPLELLQVKDSATAASIRLSIGSVRFTLLTLQEGRSPMAEAGDGPAGPWVRLGSRLIRYAGDELHME